MTTWLPLAANSASALSCGRGPGEPGNSAPGLVAAGECGRSSAAWAIIAGLVLAVATPKLIVVDSGLAGHLVGINLKRAKHPTAPVGPLVENLVLGELARQLTWADEPVRLYHYRDRDKHEVDAVLERASGEVVAVEVKAGETVRGEDFRGIRHLQDRLGDRLVAGIVLYAGSQVLPFGERLRALPISALWAGPG